VRQEEKIRGYVTFMTKEQLDHGKDQVEVVEVGGESKAVCAMADTGFNNKWA
jgi:hypothetical protein